MTTKKQRRIQAFEKGERAREAERQVGLNALRKIQLERERKEAETGNIQA